MGLWVCRELRGMGVDVGALCGPLAAAAGAEPANDSSGASSRRIEPVNYVQPEVLRCRIPARGGLTGGGVEKGVCGRSAIFFSHARLM